MPQRRIARVFFTAAIVIAFTFIWQPARAAVIFDNSNTGGVSNCPAPLNDCSPKFTLATPTFIDQISTYHWNGGSGEVPGRVSIAIRTAAGQLLGSFQAVGTPGTNGVLANWTATVRRTLAAGRYAVVDSRPETWSQNPSSGNKGFAIVTGTATFAGLPHLPLPRAGGPARPATAPRPIPCTLRGGFQFLCFGDVITASSNPVVLGDPLTLTVNPASGYSFDAKTVIVLEPISGVGFGVGLRTLCGGLSGGAAAAPCPVMAPKSLTIPTPNNGSIPNGSYLLRAENWEPSVVVLGVGTCSPTCTEADAGVLRFTNTPPSTLQITNVHYPDPQGQIVVEFVDPPQSVNNIQVLPWTGYQWGSPISWNPGAAGMSAGQLFIRVGCSPGQTYTILIILSDATGQTAQQKFTYTCR